ANVGSVAEADAAVAAGAPGVGLLRTEMPFLTAAGWPTVAAHVAALAPVLRRFPGAPVTVRTLDFAADKLPSFLRAGAAGLAGGAAGRGLPLMLAAGDAFADQFRAILDAGAGVDLRVMIPMVAGVDELRACRALLAKAAAEAGTATPPLGAMVELPDAVAAIEALAAEADFLSIGSNDLTAAILGLDRRDPALTPARAAEPAVLRAIEAVVGAAARHGRPVSVCGDAAADPDVVPVLLRLGIGTLSVAPAALDEVRALVRDTDVTAPDRDR
ncbi:MAG TPA: putative PEP-binding protein, partial [Pilimelia sp.]|nr:putative PEP-binding protein [Pilimelia sp.]